MRQALAVLSVASAVALAATLQAQQRPPRDGPLAPLVGTATISGTVSATDGEAKPLSRAQLMIMGDNGYLKIVESDGQGHFSFALIPAGRYMIGATRPPYLDTSYGAKRPGRPGTAINVTEGQRITDIALKMTRGGAVTGFVTDERGQPVPNATVRALPVEIKNGERLVGAANTSSMMPSALIASGGTGRTDERGVYRLYGMAPGDYAVVVTIQGDAGADVRVLTAAEIQAGLQAVREPGRPGVERPSMGPPAPMTPSVGPAIPPPPGPPPLPLPPATGATMGFAPTFYPGTIDVGDAASVVVAAGAERGGVDIRTRLVPMARVEGLVAVPFGQPVTNVQVTARSAGNTSLLGIMQPIQTSARPSPEGRFILNGVPPGRYTLTARTQAGASGGGGRGGVPPPDSQSSSAPVAPPQALWATTDIVVSGQPLSGIVLTMQPGMTVAGKVVFKAVGAPEPKDINVIVSVRAPQAASIFDIVGSGTAVKADRTFAVEGLVPARYLVTANITPGGGSTFTDAFKWSIESVTIGGRDVTDQAIELKPNDDIKDAVITLTDRKQEVYGTLKESSGRPAPDYTVVLFSTDKQYWLTGSRRIATARPSTDGRFEVSSPLGLPPGSYFLAAITDLGGDEQYDTKLLEDLSKGAVKLTLAAGERKLQDLRIK